MRVGGRREDGYTPKGGRERGTEGDREREERERERQGERERAGEREGERQGERERAGEREGEPEGEPEPHFLKLIVIHEAHNLLVTSRLSCTAFAQMCGTK